MIDLRPSNVFWEKLLHVCILDPLYVYHNGSIVVSNCMWESALTIDIEHIMLLPLIDVFL